MTTHRYDPKDVEISFIDRETGVRHTFRGDDVKSFEVERSMFLKARSIMHNHPALPEDSFAGGEGTVLYNPSKPDPRAIDRALAEQRTGLALVRMHRANPSPTRVIFLTEVKHGDWVMRVHPGIGLHHLEGLPRDGDVVWRGGELWRVRR